MTDAIHEDVSQEEESFELNDERQDYINQLAAQRSKERDEELGIEPTDEAAEVPEDEPEEESEEEHEETPPAQPEPAPQTVKVKVDGEERDVPLSEVIAQYQKGQAADRRLEEAARLKREAEQRATQLPPLPEKGAEKEEGISRSDLIKALQYGTEEEAAEAFEKYEARLRPSVDTETVYAEINRRMEAQRLEDQWRGANEDIAKDQQLYGLVFQRTAQKVRGGDERSVFEIATEEAEAVRSWLKSYAPTPPARSEKLDKKRGLDKVPAAETKQTPPPEKKPKTTAEIIAEMSASRPGG